MNDPIIAVQQGYSSLRRSEKKVADFVLTHPHDSLNSSIADLAKKAEVSEPTVIRFCKAIGCSGYQDFRLKLAKTMGSIDTATPQFAEFSLNPGDSLEDLSRKVFDSSIREILQVKQALDFRLIETATRVIARARRVEFFGFGASGIVAQDAQHKFMRLKPLTFASSDPHLQLISASTMTEADVVIAISHSGRSRELIESVKQAKKRGATIIGVCSDHTPLAEYCHIPLSIEAREDTALFTPLSSRIAHLVVIDVLATAVAVLKQPDIAEQLRKIKQSLSVGKVET
ncbi:transcriptional regulator [Endozoicomonas montiporae]|uniref:Transcriptional regulator n=2 Tax=Endozoicomonas montiporae TaxID=1027273 RepID=A0A081N0D8_9GAMM|nr:SIS domain-containing protein [Endozoicomonas montiporae]AMO54366.1 RpiR family transcriptional regulator [Endozoicomonas montiporae CL-33]KEQ11911.1 transcriptional regulator [Endozoicomonas montiporae]